MTNLFLGWGRVTQALANCVNGDYWVFDEVAGQLLVGKNGTDFQSLDGNFDTFDWAPYLPAQVFLSPGIDTRRPFFKHLESYEVRELDFFCGRFKGAIIAITGTDGKSTATYQLGEILRRALPEKCIFVGGNIGCAMAHALKPGDNYDIAVLEVSSYQCERLKTSRLDYAIILNLDVDHLNRYDTLADYHRAKWNLLRFAENLCYPTDVQPMGDGVEFARLKEKEEWPLRDHQPFRSSCVYFSQTEELSVVIRRLAERLAQHWNFSLSAEMLEHLPKLPHRLEAFESAQGLACLDDSKATTVHATLYGLRYAQNRYAGVVLLLGGRDKGDDFSRLRSALRAGDLVLVFGEARDTIIQQLNGEEIQDSSMKEELSGPALVSENSKPAGETTRLHVFRSLREALEWCQSQAWSSSTCLLLSPGCSSFDEFKNFEERGRFFKSVMGAKS